MVNPPSTMVRLPRALFAECLAYDRCLKTDEPAVDKVSLAWPSNGLVRRLGPSAVALTLAAPMCACSSACFGSDLSRQVWRWLPPAPGPSSWPRPACSTGTEPRPAGG